MAINYIKIAAWFEALGAAQNVATFSTPKQLDWDTVLKESQILRVITRGEQMTSMRLQQAKLERLTSSKMNELVEELSGELPSLTEVEAPKRRKSKAKRKSVNTQQMPELLPINTSGDLFA